VVSIYDKLKVEKKLQKLRQKYDGNK
jgi:hypothetical protein